MEDLQRYEKFLTSEQYEEIIIRETKKVFYSVEMNLNIPKDLQINTLMNVGFSILIQAAMNHSDFEEVLIVYSYHMKKVLDKIERQIKEKNTEDV